MILKQETSFRTLVVILAVVLGSVLGVTGSSQAATGVLQIVIAGQFLSMTIAGVDNTDLVLTLIGSLP